MTAKLVFLDTETTSLADDRRPWEVAMIHRNADGDMSTNIFVADVDLTEADPRSLKVGQFYDRHPWARGEQEPYSTFMSPNVVRTEAETADMVESWTRDAYVVASNPAFDVGTLAPMLKRHKLVPAWNYHLIDVRAMAIGFLTGLATHGHSSTSCVERCFIPDVPLSTAKSDDLARWCGVNPADYGRHTAMGDTEMVRDWYDAMVGAHE